MNTAALKATAANVPLFVASKTRHVQPLQRDYFL
jgi:hypothetical protein